MNEKDWNLTCDEGYSADIPHSGYVPIQMGWSNIPYTGNFNTRDLVIGFSRAMRVWNFALENVEFHFAGGVEPLAKVQWVKMVPNHNGVTPFATAQPGRISFASNYPYWDLDMFFRTSLHELGHVLGLGHHSGRGVMRAGLGKHRELTEDDLEAVKARGYNVR